ncbi:AraC family transcriptional regulator [Enterococcus sp. LJL128]|uniref:AraC family transcriptional regulator n=1 Tax=Enterococcus sp. LJL51 TaxID=3416656 RepID=UPI003CE8F1BD
MLIHEVVRSENPLLPLKIWNQRLSGPELSSPVHWHRSLEILLIASGRVGIEIEGKQQILQEKELIVINSGDTHQIFSVAAEDKMEGVTLLIPSDFVQSWFPYYDQGRFNQLAVQSKQHLFYPIVEEIGRLYQSEEAYYEGEIGSLLLDLLVQLYRNTWAAATAAESQLEIKERLSPVLSLVEKSYQNPLSLEQAAKASGYSVSYFSKIFTETMKISFYQYLIEFRLNKTLKELHYANKTVTDIAIENGFSSIHSYIQGFKKKYQLTPKEYQMKIRNQHK